MKPLYKITNGVLLIIIGILHTQFALSPDGFGKQIFKFANTFFFRISNGLEELPATIGKTDFETFAAFWFFYFGLMLIPLGLLVHSMEKNKRILPHYFTVTYLVFILLGCYMVPNSGMTFFMLPHAIYMLGINYYRARKDKKAQPETMD